MRSGQGEPQRGSVEPLRFFTSCRSGCRRRGTQPSLDPCGEAAGTPRWHRGEARLVVPRDAPPHAGTGDPALSGQPCRAEKYVSERHSRALQVPQSPIAPHGSHSLPQPLRLTHLTAHNPSRTLTAPQPSAPSRDPTASQTRAPYRPSGSPQLAAPHRLHIAPHKPFTAAQRYPQPHTPHKPQPLRDLRAPHRRAHPTALSRTPLTNPKGFGPVHLTTYSPSAPQECHSSPQPLKPYTPHGSSAPQGSHSPPQPITDPRAPLKDPTAISSAHLTAPKAASVPYGPHKHQTRAPLSPSQTPQISERPSWPTTPHRLHSPSAPP